MNVKPETQNRRLELTGLAKASQTRGLTGTDAGLAPQKSVGQVIGRVWNRSDLFLRCKPGPLACYPDHLVTLDIMHIGKVGMKFQHHTQQLPTLVMELVHYHIVLLIPWLRLHDVAVRFESNPVTFGSQNCTTHCHDAPITVQGVTEESPEPAHLQEKGILEPQIYPHEPF